MNIRSFDLLKDYEDIFNWWTKHNWAPIMPHSLPTTGIVVENDSKKLCAGFLYRTDSNLCWMEFIISNPDSEKEERDISLDLLISELIIKAEEFNCKVIFSSINHPSLIERYKKHNFVETDKQMTNMIRSIY